MELTQLSAGSPCCRLESHGYSRRFIASQAFSNTFIDWQLFGLRHFQAEEATLAASKSPLRNFTKYGVRSRFRSSVSAR